MKVPGSESSTSISLPGTKVPSMQLSFLGAKVRRNESSIIRKRWMCGSVDVATGKRRILMQRTSAFYPSYAATSLDQ